jgi:CubicO group peptidase (beta-lactamase class C family)
MSTAIDGFVEPGFEGVRDAFLTNFTTHGEVGAGVSVHVEGHKVVDLWGGVAEQETGTPYTDDTLQLVYSTTKGATAACANLLAQRGQLDLDAPVADYWPEFAQADKDDIPVRWLLCHKAGLPTIDKQLSCEEVLAWEPMIRALEVQSPLWEPGTAHGYHAVTFGYLVGEVVRRITGRTLGTFFAEEIAGPLGLEFWIGLPQEHEHRVAPMIGGLKPSDVADLDPKLKEMLEAFIGPASLLGRALSANGAFTDSEVFNTRAVHAAEVPAANGITNARSLSRMYAGLVGALDEAAAAPLFTEAQIHALSTRQTEGADRCIFINSTFGLGFFTSSPFAPYGVKGNFGHAGMGGSVGFGDPANKVGFGYVMNKMNQNLSADPRSSALIKATYDAMGVPTRYV